MGRLVRRRGLILDMAAQHGFSDVDEATALEAFQAELGGPDMAGPHIARQRPMPRHLPVLGQPYRRWTVRMAALRIVAIRKALIAETEALLEARREEPSQDSGLSEEPGAFQSEAAVDIPTRPTFLSFALPQWAFEAFVIIGAMVPGALLMVLGWKLFPDWMVHSWLLILVVGFGGWITIVSAAGAPPKSSR